MGRRLAEEEEEVRRRGRALRWKVERLPVKLRLNKTEVDNENWENVAVTPPWPRLH